MALLEVAVQSVIGSLDEGWGKRILRLLIFVVLAVALFGLYARSQFRGLRDPESMEYAQLGRRLAEGRGFTTACVRPLDIGLLQRHHRVARVESFPEVRRGPLYPALLALGLRIGRPSFEPSASGLPFAPETRVLLPANGVLLLLTALMLFLLGRRISDPRTAFVAVFLYCVSAAALSALVSARPLLLTAFLVTAALWACTAAGDAYAGRRPAAVWGGALALAGLLCAGAFLAEYAAWAALPAVALAAALAVEDHRGTAVTVVCVAFLAGVLPWLARNVYVSGLPLGSALHEVFLRSGLVADNAFEQGLARLDGMRAAAALRRGFFAGLPRVLDGDIRLLGSGVVACFFIVGLFRTVESGGADRLRWAALLGLLLMALGLAAGWRTPAELGAFLPVVTLLGTAFFFSVLEADSSTEPGRNLVLTWLLVLLGSGGTIVALLGPPARVPYPPYYPPFVSYVCGLLEPQEALCTDIPWATAWYGGRVSVLLPSSADELGRLDALGARVAGIYLTTETGDRRYLSDLVSGGSRSWLPLLNREAPKGFRFTHGTALPPGSRDQVFLTDRDRWTVVQPAVTSPAPPSAASPGRIPRPGAAP